MDEVVVLRAETSEDYAEGRALFEEYARAIDVDLCFQNFSAELEKLPVMYGPPEGALLMARAGSKTAGCVGVRRFREDICEMKRLYVRLMYRGRHLGRRLAEDAARRARELGYRRMVLDTLSSMQTAHELYASMGFKSSSAHYPNPLPGVKYFVLDL